MLLGFRAYHGVAFSFTASVFECYCDNEGVASNQLSLALRLETRKSVRCTSPAAITLDSPPNHTAARGIAYTSGLQAYTVSCTMARPQLEASFVHGGGRFRHPLLVGDGSTLVVAEGLRLSAYSATTAELQYTLLHSSPISALFLHPHSAMRVYAGCQDGSLVLWDLGTASRVQVWNLGFSLESFVVCNNTGEDVLPCSLSRFLTVQETESSPDIIL
jgi:hypothetical protein